jgi:hypothetical protein
MGLPGADYLYTIAGLGMAFVGFCSIALVLRQNLKPSKIRILRSHDYIELGVSATVFALLPPLLALFGLSAPVVFRVSSIIIAVILSFYHWFTVSRLHRTVGKLFVRVYINAIITVLIVVGLLANATGWLFEPQIGPVALAATWRLAMGLELFVLTFEVFLNDPESSQT